MKNTQNLDLTLEKNKIGAPKEVPNQTLDPIVVKGFAKKYNRKEDYAVRDISFKVEEGEFHGFIGANGAGKTTIIKSLIGAYAKFEGTVQIFGISNKKPEAKAKIGYIPESAKFPKGFSAFSYIKHLALLSGLSARQAKDEVSKQLKRVGLWDIRSKSMDKMSSGQKKKVLLAQALVHNPKVLIMDEPAANLDPQARVEFFKTLLELRDDGITIFLSSHILMELDAFVDSITIVDGGRIVYSGKTEDVTSNAKLRYLVSTSDDSKVKEYCVTKKLRHRNEVIKKQKLMIVEFVNQKNIDDFVSYLSKNKISINTLTEDRKTLDDVYEYYVQKGSVHTKGNDVRREQ